MLWLHPLGLCVKRGPERLGVAFGSGATGKCRLGEEGGRRRQPLNCLICARPIGEASGRGSHIGQTGIGQPGRSEGRGTALGPGRAGAEAAVMAAAVSGEPELGQSVGVSNQLAPSKHLGNRMDRTQFVRLRGTKEGANDQPIRFEPAKRTDVKGGGTANPPRGAARRGKGSSPEWPPRGQSHPFPEHQPEWHPKKGLCMDGPAGGHGRRRGPVRPKVELRIAGPVGAPVLVQGHRHRSERPKGAAREKVRP